MAVEKIEIRSLSNCVDSARRRATRGDARPKSVWASNFEKNTQRVMWNMSHNSVDHVWSHRVRSADWPRVSFGINAATSSSSDYTRLGLQQMMLANSSASVQRPRRDRWTSVRLAYRRGFPAGSAPWIGLPMRDGSGHLNHHRLPHYGETIALRLALATGQQTT